MSFNRAAVVLTGRRLRLGGIGQRCGLLHGRQSICARYSSSSIVTPQSAIDHNEGGSREPLSTTSVTTVSSRNVFSSQPFKQIQSITKSGKRKLNIYPFEAVEEHKDSYTSPSPSSSYLNSVGMREGYEAGRRNRNVVAITTVLAKSKTKESQEALARWEREKIAELGQAGFEQLKQDTFARGHLLHEQIEAFLLHNKIPDKNVEKEETLNIWRSIAPVLEKVSNIHMLESRIYHEGLQYRGIVDCVAEYNGEMCVIDWKTSLKRKRTLKECFEYPAQVAAYAGAINNDPLLVTTLQGTIRKGLIVSAYSDGYTEADVVELQGEDMVRFWKLWNMKLAYYRENYS
eukprot:Nk52_evm23s151 gene=Nk52_evmTU23s151